MCGSGKQEGRDREIDRKNTKEAWGVRNEVKRTQQQYQHRRKQSITEVAAVSVTERNRKKAATICPTDRKHKAATGKMQHTPHDQRKVVKEATNTHTYIHIHTHTHTHRHTETHTDTRYETPASAVTHEESVAFAREKKKFSDKTHFAPSCSLCSANTSRRQSVRLVAQRMEMEGHTRERERDRGRQRETDRSSTNERTRQEPGALSGSSDWHT